MNLHIGSAISISFDDVVAIVGWSPNKKDRKRINQRLVEMHEQNGDIAFVSAEKIKSIVITRNNMVYLSPISKETLARRSVLNVFTGG